MQMTHRDILLSNNKSLLSVIDAIDFFSAEEGQHWGHYTNPNKKQNEKKNNLMI